MSQTETRPAETGEGNAYFIAHGALEVLDTYRALGSRERDRVYAFVHDALMRQSHPDAAAMYAVMEAFQRFIDAYVTGESQEATCHSLDLTPDQYERYKAAWQAVHAVHEEVEAACFERYGAEKE